MAYIRLPNNSYFPVAEGESPKQALEEARKAYPKAFMTEGEIESKQGFMPAAGEAFKEFKTKSLMGLGELTGNATLQQMAQDASEADEKIKKENKHGFLPTEEEDIEAARKKGLMPLAGAYARKYISEPLGGIAGRYGAPMAAGAGAAGLAALAAPGAVVTGAGALGAGLLAKGVTSLADLPAEVGENIQQQIDVDAPINSTKAIAYGLGQAALAGFGIPGMGKLAAPVQKLFGKEANALAADVVAGTLTKDQALAKLSGTLKNVITGTGSAAVTGAGLMVGTQAMRRASADQDVTSPEALEEYKQNLVGAAELAPLFGVLHGVPKRGKDKKLIDQASQKFEVTKGREERARQDAEAASLADEQARTQETEGYNRAVQDTFGAPERPAEGVQGRTADMFGGTYAAPEGALPPQRALGDNLLPRERERAVQEQFVESKSPQEVMNQKENLEKYVTGLRDQVSAAAAKADIKTLGELTPKLKEVEAAYAAAYKEYSALDLPEVKFKELTNQLTRKTKELQKAGGAQGDFAKIEKLTNDIQKLQAELEKVKPPSGPDLFGVAKEQRINEEIGKYEDELGARGEDQQRTAEQNRLRKEETTRAMREIDINAAFDKYMPSKLTEQLVNESDRSAAARKITRAETSDVINAQELEANQQRVARVTAAYKEAVAKAEETREPLMLAQNKATVALEKAQETAKARTQRAVAEGVNKRNVNTLRKRLDREMQPLVDAVNKLTAEAARPQELVRQLEKRLADAQQAGARPQVENRRNQALEDQQAAIEELRSQVEDLKSGRYFGKDARDRATAASTKEGLERKANTTIGQYVEAAIRDVNAAREIGGGKRLTLDEATRLAMDVRGHLENAVRNLNVSALRMPKESTVSTLEKQLAQIKKKHIKIEPVEKKRAEGFALRPEFEVKKAEATKKLAELRKAGKADTEEYKKLQETLQGTPFETEARKTERVAEEEQERVAKERMVADVGNVEQRNLFGEKDLEPIATTRASAENFMKLLRSGTVSNMRAKIASIEKAKQEAQKIEETAKRGYSIQHNYDATYERLKNLEDTAKALEKSLDDLLMAPGQARNAIVAEKARLESVKARAAEQVKASEEKLKALEERKAKATPAAELAEEFTPRKEAELRAIDDQIKEEKRKAKAALEALKEEAHPVFKIDELQDALKKTDENFPQQLAVYNKIKDALRTRIKDLLETKVEAEKTLMKDAWEHTKQKVAAAKTVAEKNAVQAKAEKEKRLAEDRIAQSEQALKENAAKVQRENEQREFENVKLLRTTRQEIVGTNRKAQNVGELKKKERLELALGKERDAPNPDQTKIIRLERQIAALETTREVTRKKITREVPLATEIIKRETQEERRRATVEELKEKKATELERAGQKSEREKLLQKESALNKQLTQIRAQMGAAIKQRKTIENNIAKARKENTKAKWEAALKEHDKKFNLAKLEKAEQKVKDQLAEVSPQGVKTERALEVIGPKAGRENRTRVKGERVTQKDRDLLAELSDLAGLSKNVEESGIPGAYSKQYPGRSGNDNRIAEFTGQRLDANESKRITDDIEKNLPKDIKVKSVESIADLPQEVKKGLALDGFIEGSAQANTLRGFVTPTGDVYVIRGNHATAKELQVTYAHEIIGHAGVDRILGPEGVRELVKRIQAHGGAMELAKKLGVEKEVQGAIHDQAMSLQKLIDSKASPEEIKKATADLETQAVRELIAYTAEKRVDENFKQKAGRWLKELVGAVRAALRKMGFAELAGVSTSDIYQILRQSQRNFNRGELGAFREINGQMSYRNKAVFAEGFDEGMATATGKIIAQQKGFRDRIQGSVSGMSMMTRFVDRFAPLDYIARTMKDKLEGVQMMYNNRLYDQRNNMLAEIATHGSVGYTKGADGAYQYKSRGGPSLKDVFETAAQSKNKVGNGQATTDFFGMYLAMERAASDKNGFAEGLNKLDFKDKVGMAEANRILDFGRGDKNFQEARKQYREYNNGLIDLMVETGRLAERDFEAEAKMKTLEQKGKKNTSEYREMKRRAESAAVNLKNGDYVPYYRENAKGELWDTEHNIKIGDLKTQAYLKELIGGDSAIVNFETGALQNTYMLTDMAMSNIATKNTVFTLNKLGIADIRPGDGPAAPNVLRFYENGVQKHAVIETKGAHVAMEARLEAMREDGKANTPEYKKLRERAEASRMSETVYGDIPAELIVKGMEGVTTATPLAVAMMRGPANLLRKAITRNPVYAARVALKDSISGWVTSGADVTPVLGVLGNLRKSWKGGSPEVRSLQEQGIIGGHVFAGTMSDMRTVAQQIAQGQTGWEKLWAKADRLAITADEASRVTLYNGFVKKGMSPMEATLATLESQNFTKHGFSPSVRMLSTMIPFFNAQITGLNTFISNLSGKSLFEDKLGIRANMLKRGAMLAGTTMIYSALMQNNEAYKNATEQDRLNYWFIPLPFFDEPIRVPIPFESGTLFKAIPEALFNLAMSDAKAKDVLPAVAKLVLGTVPGMSNLGLPQGIKPIIEAATNTNLFTMSPIQSQRQLAKDAGQRSNTNTTEVSKMFGEALGVSPIMIDHFVNAYTSAAGIALLSMFNPALRDVGTPESKSSQLPLIGGFFQPTDGSGLIDKAYNDMAQIERINTSFKDMVEQNPEKAERYLEKNLQQIDLASAAGKFKRDMGELNKYERLIQSDRSMTREQKRKELDEIKQFKIEMAKEFMSISRE